MSLEANKVSGSTIKEKINGIDTPVSHEIRIKVSKNKLAPPFREGVFRIYYDQRKIDPLIEIVDVILKYGLIPRVGANGQPNPKGLTYKFDLDDEHIFVRKTELLDELKKCPKILKHFTDLITSGNFATDQTTIEDNMDEFISSNPANNFSAAEEIESFEDL